MLEIVGKSRGRGAALHSDGAMPATGRGSRAEPGEFPGPSTTRRLPRPHAQGRARDQSLIHTNIIMARTCGSGSRTAEEPLARLIPARSIAATKNRHPEPQSSLRSKPAGKPGAPIPRTVHDYRIQRAAAHFMLARDGV